MKRILVVEDDRGLREGIELALRREDLTFTLCESIVKAKEALAGKAMFDLILLDLNLPDGSGYDLLKEVKAGRDFPIIIITANDMEIDEVRGLELGAEDYQTIQPYGAPCQNRQGVKKCREAEKRGLVFWRVVLLF